MLKIVVRSDRASGGLRRSYVKTVGVRIAPVEFSIGAIFTLTDFTKFLLGLIASQFQFPLLHPRTLGYLNQAVNFPARTQRGSYTLFFPG